MEKDLNKGNDKNYGKKSIQDDTIALAGRSHFSILEMENENMKEEEEVNEEGKKEESPAVRRLQGKNQITSKCTNSSRFLFRKTP